MKFIGCAIRKVPADKLLESAEKAIEINPANAPNIANLPREFTPSPTSLAVLTQNFWGPAGVRLTVGFLDRPSAQLRPPILSHMNAWAHGGTSGSPRPKPIRRCGSPAFAMTVTGLTSAPTCCRFRPTSRP